MAKLDKNIFTVLGLRIQGDLGPWTCYTSKKGKPVIFLKAPPKVGPSRYQYLLRNHFRRLAIDWSNISDADKATWELASKKAGLRCHGYNLFTFFSFPGNQRSVDTIFRQAALSIPT